MNQNEIEQQTSSQHVEDGSQRKWYLTAMVWLWIATRATTLFVLDVSLWIIMTSTSADRASKPTRRVRFPHEVRSDIASQQRWKCMYCGCSLRRSNLQIDHKFPISRGGSNDYENLQALCGRCNARKGNHSDDEFRERYAELLPAVKVPPRIVIDQRHFGDVMRSTTAHENVRDVNRNPYLTPKQRLRSAIPIIIIGGTIIFAVIGGMWFQSIASEVLVFGLIFSAAFSGGLWLRASYKGLFHE